MQVTRGPVECALVLTLVDGCPRIGELAGRTKEHLIGNTLKAAGKTWYYIRARVGSGHDGGRNFESCRSCQTIVANLPFRWQGLGQGSPSTLK